MRSIYLRWGDCRHAIRKISNVDAWGCWISGFRDGATYYPVWGVCNQSRFDQGLAQKLEIRGLLSVYLRAYVVNTLISEALQNRVAATVSSTHDAG